MPPLSVWVDVDIRTDYREANGKGAHMARNRHSLSDIQNVRYRQYVYSSGKVPRYMSGRRFLIAFASII